MIRYHWLTQHVMGGGLLCTWVVWCLPLVESMAGTEA